MPQEDRGEYLKAEAAAFMKEGKGRCSHCRFTGWKVTGPRPPGTAVKQCCLNAVPGLPRHQDRTQTNPYSFPIQKADEPEESRDTFLSLVFLEGRFI